MNQQIVPSVYVMFTQTDSLGGERVLSDFFCYDWKHCSFAQQCAGSFSGKYCKYPPAMIAALRHLIDICNVKIAELESSP